MPLRAFFHTSLHVFLATVESVLLNGSETWTLTRSTEKQTDNPDTRMLHIALNVSWRDRSHHKWRAVWSSSEAFQQDQGKENENNWALRQTQREGGIKACTVAAITQRNKERPKTTYIYTLLEDTGLMTIGELRSAVMDKDDWWARIHTVWAGARPKWIITEYLRFSCWS